MSRELEKPFTQKTASGSLYAMWPTRPTARRSRTAIVAVFLSIAGAAGIVAGCGGQSAKSNVQFSPDVAGGSQRSAGDRVDLSAFVQDAPFAAPRYIIQKPLDEPTFDPSMPVTATNMLHGTVESATGRYDAPTNLRDVVNPYDSTQGSTPDLTSDAPRYVAPPLIDTIAVTDEATYDALKARCATGRQHLFNAFLSKLEEFVGPTNAANGLSGSPIPYAELQTLLQTNDETYDGAADQKRRKALLYLWSLYKPGSTDALTSAWDYALNALTTNNQSALFSRRIAEDLASGDAEPEIPTPMDQNREADAISRMMVTLTDHPVQRIRLSLLHKVVVDPGTVDVTVRGRLRLADYIKVLGDITLAGQTLNQVPDSTVKSRIAFTIENPLDGAGGKIDELGVYTAPNILTQNGKIVTSGRRAQDIIVIQSIADKSRTARVTINVVTADAPTTVDVN